MKKTVSVIALIAAIIMLSATFAPVFADGPADVTEKFTDPGFRSEVLRALGKDDYGRILEDEAAGLTRLRINGGTAFDFNGIEYLTGLKDLEIAFSPVESISVGALPSLSKIAVADCPYLSDVRLYDLPSIEVVSVDSNERLTSVELCGLPVLRAASVSFNQSMSSIELHSLTLLESLDCSFDRLKTLDLTGCPALEQLDCSGNRFASRYSIRIPEEKRYLIENVYYPEEGNYVPGNLLFSLDIENESVRDMELCHVYTTDPETVRNSGTYNSRALIGNVSELAELLGISFPFSWAELLDAQLDENGKLIPSEDGNKTFKISLMSVTDEEAIKELSWNPNIRYVERNMLYDYEPWIERTYYLPFRDVPISAWYYDNVGYVYKRGIMVGTSAVKFSPDDSLTRAMAVTVLHRLAGNPAIREKTSFTDVPDGEWYSSAVRWATKAEIVKGVSETSFSPDEAITRADFATIIYRYGDSVGYVWDRESKDKSEPTDADSIPDYAKEAVFALYRSGIVNGKENGVFDPFSPVTRAEAAAMFERIKRRCESQGISYTENMGTARRCAVGNEDAGSVIYAAHSTQDVADIISSHSANFEGEYKTLADVFSMYGDDFFEHKTLFIAFITAESGSIGLNFRGVWKFDDGYRIMIERSAPDGAVTDDLATWCVFSVIPDKDVPVSEITVVQITD